MTFDKIFTALNVVFTGLSVVAAFFALWHARRAERKSRRVQAKQLEIENRLLQIEEAREQDRLRQSQKADLFARLEKPERDKYQLVIENQGQGTATDINILLDGNPPSAYPAFYQNDFPNLLKGGHSRTIRRCFSQEALPEKYEVVWKDDSGKSRFEGNLVSR